MNTVTVFTIINSIVIVLIPIVAVIIGQYLQNREKRRDDKMKIFKTLMTDRFFGWSNESVSALNIIDIVFAKNKAVLNQWRIYKDRLTIENPTTTDINKINDAKCKLLEEMAKSLKYKNISWEVIQNPYLPKGMMDELIQRQSFQNNQVQVMEILKTQLEKGNAPQINNNPTQNGIIL